MGKRQEDEAQLADARVALAEQLAKLLGDQPPLPGRAGQADPPKVIRDSFSLPEDDYQLIAALQERALDVRLRVSKSEVLRAGLHALRAMSDPDLRAVLLGVEKLKPGRRKEK